MKQLFILFFFIPCLLQANAIRWSGNKVPLDIGNKVYVLEDAGGRFSFDDVLSNEKQAQFKPSDKANLTLGYTSSVFWIKFSFVNETADQLVLEIAQAGLPLCELYAKTDSNNLIVLKAGSNTSFKDRIIKNSFQVFPLQQGKVDYYIRLTTNSGPIPFKIFSNDDYEANALSQRFVYGIYLGLMVFVFVSNIFFFFSLRNFLYLANAVNVVIFICYSMVVVDGFVVYFFEKVDMLFWYTTIPPIGVTIQTIYSLWFLEVKKYRPRLYRIVSGVVVVYIVWFIARFFLSFPVVQPINTLQALLSFFIMGFIGIRVGQKGNRFGYYFALTYFFYFLLVLAEATYINTGKPTYLLGFSYSGYATILEAMALSFLLTKRFEWEKKEIEEAELEAKQMLLEKTIENEQLVRSQNVLLEQKVEERTHQLKEEKEKSDALLLNILPEETAQELKLNGKAKPRTYGMVSVVFTDFKDFTMLSEKLTPELLVEEIDYCFSAFDKIISKYSIEKIKTVGDAYIAASGLPSPNYNHAIDAVKVALEIRDFMTNRKLEKARRGEAPFEIRIGIHTGPLVAGIVGIKKFAYDIWGDTVNIASRMESSGEAGKVNISGTTYELIKDEFTCTYRGKIEAKHKGGIDMYFVE